jgi:hypothetical protein
VGDGTGDEAGAETQLIGCQTAGVTSGGLVHTRNFKQHVTGKNHSNPEFRGALTFTHSGFRRTCGHGLVRENSDENLALALEKAGDRDTTGLDLVVLQPTTLKNLKAELAEIQLVGTGGIACTIAALGFAIFYSTGKKGHGDLKWEVWKRGSQEGAAENRLGLIQQQQPVRLQQQQGLRLLHEGREGRRAHHDGEDRHGHRDRGVHDAHDEGRWRHLHLHCHGSTRP